MIFQYIVYIAKSPSQIFKNVTDYKISFISFFRGDVGLQLLQFRRKFYNQEKNIEFP